MKATYRTVNEENARELEDEGEYDLIVIHDPQPLGMLDHLEATMPTVPIVWRCHIDLTDPTEVPRVRLRVHEAGRPRDLQPIRLHRRHRGSGDEHHLPVDRSRHGENRSLDAETVSAACDRLDPLSFENPVVTQISRFDPWKDQFGTLEAYRRASETCRTSS